MAASGFRPDIEGLRAVAVGLVVAFHAGVPLVGGGFVGVDVFFVISGFLITGLLAKELHRSGSVSLTGFYARRVRRLLPLSTVVLVSVATAALFVVPVINRPDLAGDVRSSALWFANWHFAAGSTQYMADVDKSPVLHYWSLSVEEQFYVLWPLLILLVAGFSRTRRHTAWSVLRNRLVLALSLVLVASFTWSVLSTGDSGPWAYFGLHTRAWELAAGGLLALLAPALRQLTRRAGVVFGLVGLAMIVVSALAFSRSTPFPGWAAALPVAGAVLVLAAGERTQDGAGRLLGTGPFMYVGRISYGWYLWHWPCLVLAGVIWAPAVDDPDLVASSARSLGLWPVLGAVVVSFLLASLTYRVVEAPVRRSRVLVVSRARTLSFGAALLVVAVSVPAVLLGSGGSVPAVAAAAVQDDSTDWAGLPIPGASPSAPSGDAARSAQLLYVAPKGQAPARTASMTPAQARSDNGSPANCFIDFPSTTVDPACVFGDPHGSKVVVLFGDSNAAQWFPAVRRIATRYGWKLYFWAKPACAFADVRQFTTAFNREFTECAQWRKSVYAQLDTMPRIDMIVVGRNLSYADSVMDETDQVPRGAAGFAIWKQGVDKSFARLGTLTQRVVMMLDVPRPGQNVPTCLSRNPTNPSACDFARAKAVHVDQKIFDVEKTVLPPGNVVRYVDMTDAICTSDPCSVLSHTGTVLFRDVHHMTATFARELAPTLAKILLPLLPAA